MLFRSIFYYLFYLFNAISIFVTIAVKVTKASLKLLKIGILILPNFKTNLLFLKKSKVLYLNKLIKTIKKLFKMIFIGALKIVWIKLSKLEL